MPRPLPPYVVRQVTRHGKTVFYFRKGKGKRTRLPNDPTSDEFDAAYASLRYGHQEPDAVVIRSGSMSWLVKKYEESGAFKRLAASTQRARMAMLKSVIKTSPDFQADSMQTKHILAGMDRRHGEAANNFLRAVKHLFAWAKSLELVSEDPCIGVKKAKVRKQDAPIWTPDDIKKFRDKWSVGTKQRLAFEIMLNAGLARADAVRLGRQHVKDGMIHIARKKTGVFQYMSVTVELQQVLDAAPIENMTYIVTEFGRPFNDASFGGWFAKQCKAAKVPDKCRSHGLRRTCAINLAEVGVTTLEMMAMMGWKTIEEAELYTRRADKLSLAKAGGERRANKTAPHLSSQIPHLSKKT